MNKYAFASGSHSALCSASSGGSALALAHAHAAQQNSVERRHIRVLQPRLDRRRRRREAAGAARAVGSSYWRACNTLADLACVASNRRAQPVERNAYQHPPLQV
jgi:hypothetical protein